MTTQERKRTLRSSYMGREIFKNYWAEAHACKEQGRPVAWCSGNVPVELVHANGVYPLYPESYSAMIAAQKMAREKCERAEGWGYSMDTCSYFRVSLGMEDDDPKTLPFGGLPRPDILITTRLICMTQYKWWQVLSDMWDVPIYVVDAPYLGLGGQAQIQRHQEDYFIDQLKGLVAFLEEHTGKRMDQDRFLEALALSDRAAELWYEIMGLRKSRPCPVATREMVGNVFPLVTLLGTRPTVDFFQALRDEIKEMVESGQGAVPDERIRLALDNIPPWHDLAFLSSVEERGAIFAIENYTCYAWGGRIDLSDPWRGYARKCLDTWPAYSIEERIQIYIRQAQEYHLDGYVFHANRSCKPLSTAQQEMQRVLLERVGVPGLLLEGDHADPRGFSPAHAQSQLEAFLEMLGA
ncbi:MAG: 2-hydroxyacyl-CoA dehydratase family protein [Dehalococcoidia bacterium]|nr:2-hydroxyacyl-CoA dehydratase family protein [Dehalococcoidia bacterium]